MVQFMDVMSLQSGGAGPVSNECPVVCKYAPEQNGVCRAI